MGFNQRTNAVSEGEKTPKTILSFTAPSPGHSYKK